MWRQVGLRKHHKNKASGGDGIPVEVFQILKDDAVKVLHSICQQIWKTQQWPQDWKRWVFIPIPKKGSAKERSNYHTIALISRASKVMLKILQARFQKYMNHHGYTCVPHPEPPSHLPPHPIPLVHPSAPAQSTLYHALNLDWRFVSHMIISTFQCQGGFMSMYGKTNTIL